MFVIYKVDEGGLKIVPKVAYNCYNCVLLTIVACKTYNEKI
jgi:hypothetical protein